LKFSANVCGAKVRSKNPNGDDSGYVRKEIEYKFGLSVKAVIISRLSTPFLTFQLLSDILKSVKFEKCAPWALKYKKLQKLISFC